MNESKRLHQTAPVTVLRRITLAAAIGATLVGSTASAGPDPTDRYIGRMNALVDALDDAGTNCDKAALALERDADPTLDKLMSDIRGFTVAPSADARFRGTSVPLIQAVLETSSWRACAKVTNVRFALAASHHPIFRGSRIARAYAAQTEQDVFEFETALAAQAELMEKLDATRGCSARAALVRGNTTARTKRQKAAEEHLLFSEDVEQMQYAANRVGEIIPPELSTRVMRACSTHDGFMNAAYKHPFLSVFAEDFDARKSRPAAARTRSSRER